GAIVGAFLILPIMNELTLAITFAVVAGIMVFISFDELLPAAKNTTQSIGIYTTKSVVNAIFWVIAFDALFSVVLTIMEV
ncbi:hypothetical protein VWM68_11180, partial [Campylobacter coli]